MFFNAYVLFENTREEKNNRLASTCAGDMREVVHYYISFKCTLENIAAAFNCAFFLRWTLNIN